MSGVEISGVRHQAWVMSPGTKIIIKLNNCQSVVLRSQLGTNLIDGKLSRVEKCFEMKSPDVLPDLTQWIPSRTAFVFTISADNKNDFDSLIVHNILNALLCVLCQFLLQYLI